MVSFAASARRLAIWRTASTSSGRVCRALWETASPGMGFSPFTIRIFPGWPVVRQCRCALFKTSSYRVVSRNDIVVFGFRLDTMQSARLA
jgi:hypothetical protein